MRSANQDAVPASLFTAGRAPFKKAASSSAFSGFASKRMSNPTCDMSVSSWAASGLRTVFFSVLSACAAHLESACVVHETEVTPDPQIRKASRSADTLPEGGRIQSRPPNHARRPGRVVSSPTLVRRGRQPQMTTSFLSRRVRKSTNRCTRVGVRDPDGHTAWAGIGVSVKSSSTISASPASMASRAW